jgi:DNA polymerase-3 subunit epsilon
VIPLSAFMFDAPPEGEWVSLDCETTGLNVRTDEIVSIGAVRIVGNRIMTSERLELLVRPEQGGVGRERAHSPPARARRGAGPAHRRGLEAADALHWQPARWSAITWSSTWPC